MPQTSFDIEDAEYFLNRLKDFCEVLQEEWLRVCNQWYNLKSSWYDRHIYEFEEIFERLSSTYSWAIKDCEQRIKTLENKIKIAESVNELEDLSYLLGLSYSLSFDDNQSSKTASNKEHNDIWNISITDSISISSTEGKLTQDDRSKLLLEVVKAKQKYPDLPLEIIEGIGFEKFYIKNKLDSRYTVQFHHNPYNEKRRADAFAILEKEGEEVFHYVEIMRSAKAFTKKNNHKFDQAETYGDTLGHSLVLGKPVSMKYVFFESPTLEQIKNLKNVIQAGIQQSIKQRFQQLVKEGVSPCKLTQNPKFELKIEIWK